MSTTTVNGKSLPLSGFPTHGSALDFLRAGGLLGAKEGCAEGECGACAVLVARPGVATATEWTAVNACLMPAASLADQEVRTAEGLADESARQVADLHPVQREMAERGGSQCGYCTPGFVCSMAAEYYRPDRGDTFDLHALSGNLCRCTGYRPIKDAGEALGAPPAGDRLAERCSHAPPSLGPVRADGFVRPATLVDALRIFAENPGATPVSGGTDIGVDINLKGFRPELVLSIGHLPELRGVSVSERYAEFGSALTLSELERRLGPVVPLLGKLLPQFASRLIRNSATVGGSLGTASPIGDLAPVLLALDATLVLASAAGRRDVPLGEYFTGYRSTVRRPGELIELIRVPREPNSPQPSQTSTRNAFYKIAKRKYDDISSVAVAVVLTIDHGVITRARIGLGGVAATPVRAVATETSLLDRPFTEATIEAAAEVLSLEGTPMSDHRASAAFRSAMLGESLRRFFHETREAR